MRRSFKIILILVFVAFLLSGCMVRTVDQMYCLPRRSETYNSLQSAINEAMSDLEYCAPISGDNQQTVHMTDMDGDGMQEYLVFARESTEPSLCILIFANVNGSFVHIDTILCNGTAFDKVEYVQIDDRGGMEIVIGRIFSDPMLRTVSVYSLVDRKAVQMMSANYTSFLTLDMDANGCEELFLIRSSLTDADRGAVECYRFTQDSMECSNTLPLSGTGEKLHKVVSGTLQDGQMAVFVVGSVENTTLITDIYVLSEDTLLNIANPNQTVALEQTFWNYYLFPQDVDGDGEVELPQLIKETLPGGVQRVNRSCLVRWYSISTDQTETDKRYTFHDFYDGWYVEFDTQIGPMLTVSEKKQAFEFYSDASLDATQKLLTVLVIKDYHGDPFSALEDRFTIFKSETMTYAAILGPTAQHYGITEEQIIRSFHLIPEDWKIERS